jgi:hypothetical protein
MIPSSEIVMRTVIIVKVFFTNEPTYFKWKDKRFSPYQASGKNTACLSQPRFLSAIFNELLKAPGKMFLNQRFFKKDLYTKLKYD